jgi:hypothetical protein
MRVKTVFKILVLLIAVITAAFILFWMRPAKVVQDAFEKLAISSSQAFQATISVSNPQASVDILGEQASVNLDIDGKFTREDNKRDSFEATVQLTTKTETLTLLIEANTKFIDEKAYFQITRTPSTIPTLAQLKGQWIELPRGTKKEASTLPEKNRTFTKVEAGDKQEIDGVTTKTYHATATSAAVIRMLDSIASILGTHLTAEQINNIQQGIAEAENLPIELAVTPWTREIRRIKSSTTVPNSNNNIDIQFTFSDRNKLFVITAPEGAQTLGSIAGLKTDQNRQ